MGRRSLYTLFLGKIQAIPRLPIKAVSGQDDKAEISSPLGVTGTGKKSP
jgi:hypothetical protein